MGILLTTASGHYVHYPQARPRGLGLDTASAMARVPGSLCITDGTSTGRRRRKRVSLNASNLSERAACRHIR